MVRILGVLLFGALIALSVFAMRLPMSLLAARVPIQYADTSGSLWHGEIQGLVVSGQALGTLRLKTHLLPLLTGRMRADFEVSGAGVDGQGGFGFSKTALSAQDTELVVDLARYDLIDAFGQKLRGRLNADVRRLDFGVQGCRRADLSVTTDAVSKSLGAFAERGFPLSGEGRCDGDVLLIPLTGGSDEVDVAAELRIEPTGRYTTRLAITPHRDDIEFFLIGLGFASEGNAFVRRSEGRIAVNL